MTSLREETDAQIAKLRKTKPEFAQQIDALMSSSESFQAGSDALTVGQKAPDFVLPDPHGAEVSLSGLLAKGPVVVTFYRGGWCPYCNLQLRAIQTRLADMHALSAELVAISPQVPDESLAQLERDPLAFPVLSDQDARVAAEYGVAWEVPDAILDHMRKDRNLELTEINGGNGHVLPIPGTFVLGRDGLVKWRYVNVDYRYRAEPEDVVAAVRALEK